MCAYFKVATIFIAFYANFRKFFLSFSVRHMPHWQLVPFTSCLAIQKQVTKSGKYIRFWVQQHFNVNNSEDK